MGRAALVAVVAVVAVVARLVMARLVAMMTPDSVAKAFKLPPPRQQLELQWHGRC